MVELVKCFGGEGEEGREGEGGMVQLGWGVYRREKERD